MNHRQLQILNLASSLQEIFLQDVGHISKLMSLSATKFSSRAKSSADYVGGIHRPSPATPKNPILTQILA